MIPSIFPPPPPPPQFHINSLQLLLLVVAKGVAIFFSLFIPSLQLSLCLLSLVVLGVLCFCKPYTHFRTNIIEAATLLDLVLVAFIFLNTKESAQVNPAIFQILLLLPYLYAIIYIIIKSTLALW